ncbi:MAG: hypothetical protein V3T86_04220 [Planctomycetota bacterium]
MTDDPVKLFVAVMGLLLAVLSWVCYESYRKADAFERALQSADKDSETIRELGSRVQSMCDTITKGKIESGYLPFIESEMNRFQIKSSKRGQEARPKSIGARLEEHRFFVEFFRTRDSSALRRDKIGEFCSHVERDSHGLLKTIELRLTRSTPKGAPAPGHSDEVRDDTYTGRIVFGYRTAKER